VSSHSEGRHYQFVLAHNVGQADDGVKSKLCPKYSNTGSRTIGQLQQTKPSTRKIEAFRSAAAVCAKSLRHIFQTILVTSVNHDLRRRHCRRRPGWTFLACEIGPAGASVLLLEKNRQPDQSAQEMDRWEHADLTSPPRWFRADLYSEGGPLLIQVWSSKRTRAVSLSRKAASRNRRVRKNGIDSSHAVD